MSSECPAFDGLMIDEYTTLDNDNISFQIPESLSAYDGEYDVVVTNRWNGCIGIDKEKRPKNNNVNLGQFD